MAELAISVKHGEPFETAQANFEKAIVAAQVEYGRWIRQVDWAADRRSAVLSGPSYRVSIHLDEQFIHIRGNVPLAIRLLERPIRGFVERVLSANSSDGRTNQHIERD